MARRKRRKLTEQEKQALWQSVEKPIIQVSPKFNDQISQIGNHLPTANWRNDVKRISLVFIVVLIILSSAIAVDRRTTLLLKSGQYLVAVLHLK